MLIGEIVGIIKQLKRWVLSGLKLLGGMAIDEFTEICIGCIYRIKTYICSMVYFHSFLVKLDHGTAAFIGMYTLQPVSCELALHPVLSGKSKGRHAWFPHKSNHMSHVFSDLFWNAFRMFKVWLLELWASQVWNVGCQEGAPRLRLSQRFAWHGPWALQKSDFLAVLGTHLREAIGPWPLC